MTVTSVLGVPVGEDLDKRKMEAQLRDDRRYELARAIVPALIHGVAFVDDGRGAMELPDVPRIAVAMADEILNALTVEVPVNASD